MTLEEYIRKNNGKSIDHAIRAHVNGGKVEFYIHPQGVDGDTCDFVVSGNELKPKPLVVDGIPRRSRMDHWTPAEKAIYAALQAVEAIGADVRLTKAVALISEAQDLVADFIEDEQASK